MDTQSIVVDITLFIVLMVYATSLTVVTIVMVAIVCTLVRKKRKYCPNCKIKIHGMTSNTNAATTTQTHQETPSPTKVEETPKKTLTISKSLPLRIDRKEEIGFYSYAYDEIQYPIAVRNGFNNIKGLIRDSDPTYAKFVTLPSSLKSKIVKKSYGSQDHLEFLRELREFQRGDVAESSYMKARTFSPRENCPQNLRLLIMDLGRRQAFSGKTASDVLL